MYLQIFIEGDKDEIDTANDNTLTVNNKSPRGNPRHTASIGSNASDTSPTRSTEYAYVTVTAQSTASDVIASVAKKRNVYENRGEYKLVVCDSDGSQKIEATLDDDDLPYERQQRAMVHGHLGDFHFVFRKNTEGDNDDDSEQSFFPPNIRGTPKSGPLHQTKLMVFINFHMFVFVCKQKVEQRKKRPNSQNCTSNSCFLCLLFPFLFVLWQEKNVSKQKVATKEDQSGMFYFFRFCFGDLLACQSLMHTILFVFVCLFE